MLSCGVGNAGEISSGVVNFTFLRAQHSFKYVEIHILEETGFIHAAECVPLIRNRNVSVSSLTELSKHG